MKLQIIVGSTRPGRIGLAIAQWLDAIARDAGTFEVELVDIAEYELPLFDEPEHPRLGNYRNAPTIRWSAKIAEADAFFFVTPEYNHSLPASLKNALDFLNAEWAGKPASILSYGGMSGGIRAAQHLKLVLSVLRVVVVPQAVAVPNVTAFRDADGAFLGSDTQRSEVLRAVAQLATWAQTLDAVRANTIASK